MINVSLKSPVTNCTLAHQKGLTGECTLVTESLRTLNAKCYSGVNTGIETVNIVTPLSDESIFITDIIVTSTKKVALSTIVIQLSDGVNTEVFMEIQAADAAVQFSHAFSGGVLGWKDAIFQVVTDKAAMNVTTLVGYIKVGKLLTKTYSEWNAER